MLRIQPRDAPLFQRWQTVKSRVQEMPIEKVVDTIINDVEVYTAYEEQDDDITLVAVRVA